MITRTPRACRDDIAYRKQENDDRCSLSEQTTVIDFSVSTTKIPQSSVLLVFFQFVCLLVQNLVVYKSCHYWKDQVSITLLKVESHIFLTLP